MLTRSSKLVEEVTNDLAAYIWNSLPQIAKLPCVEGFERLAKLFRNAFMNCFDGREGRCFPEPSRN